MGGRKGIAHFRTKVLAEDQDIRSLKILILSPYLRLNCLGRVPDIEILQVIPRSSKVYEPCKSKKAVESDLWEKFRLYYFPDETNSATHLPHPFLPCPTSPHLAPFTLPL